MATTELAVQDRLESRFVTAFEMHDGHTLNGTNASLQRHRREAIRRFEELGFPGRKNEAWKYTNIRPALSRDYRIVVAGDAAREDFDIQPFLIPELDAHLIVTVNGRFSDQLSQIGSLPKGVIVTGFAKAAAQHPELVDRYFNKTANVENESFTALNTAFVQDGVFVFVPKNTVVEKPLHIINVLTSHDDVFVQPRNLLVFEENSQAKLIESGHHREEARAFTNSVEEIFVARAANVDYYKIQDEGDTASQVNGTYVHQADSSVFSVNTITLSGAVVRNNLTVTLDGEHIESHLIGLVLPTGSQHIDVSTLIDHARPHCVSNELYKYVLDDASEGVFNGKVFVRQDAQQTNAFQENKSILLTETATMNAKPELEIYADDVKCSHGATTGQLDAEALFYLRSRGLPERLARGILLLAFARDILESVRIDALRTWLDQKMHERFAS